MEHCFPRHGHALFTVRRRTGDNGQGLFCGFGIRAMLVLVEVRTTVVIKIEQCIQTVQRVEKPMTKFVNVIDPVSVGVAGLAERDFENAVKSRLG